MILAQPGNGEAELCERPGLEILHEHVGALEHGLEQGLVLLLREIEDDRFLAAVEPDEIAAFAAGDGVVGAGEIAFGTLDLDHARAGVGEPAGAHRRRDRLLDRDDEKALQRESHSKLQRFG